MNKGTIISLILAVLAVTGMVFAFLNNSSDYVTVADARTISDRSVHVVGDIDKSTVVNRLREGVTMFTIKDEAGDALPVVYKGAPISNLGSATRIVCIGSMKGDSFAAKSVLVKCPSKYEGEEGNAK